MLEAKREAEERRRQLAVRLRLPAVEATPVHDDALPEHRASSNLLPVVDFGSRIKIPDSVDATEVPSGRLSIEQLIESADVSVRLHNCFLNNREVFEQFSVADVLADRDLFFSTIVKCSNLGKKTAIEVLELVDLYHRDPWEIVGHLPSDDDLVKGGSVPETPILTDAEQYLQSEKIIDILLNLDISTRLSNVVKSGEFDATTIADFIADPGELNSKFMAASNSGRKTAGEAMVLLSHHVEMSRKSAESVVGGEEGADDIQPIGLPHDGIDDASPPRVRIQKLLAALQPKELQVLTERYGLDDRPPRTLNDIAQRVHVTRERVRQVEAKAIRRLQKTQRGRTAFEALIEAENESTWCALCDASPYLADSQLAEKARGLDPIFLLAIDVVHEDVRTWISTIAHQSDAGWFRNLAEATRMMESQTEIEVIANRMATPLPPAHFRKMMGATCHETLTGEGRNWEFFEEYLCVGYVGAKTRRLVRMHQIATSEFGSGMFELCKLIQMYRRLYPEDDCGSRIFQMQADDATHLFARLFDNIWICLPKSKTALVLSTEPPFEREAFEDDGFSDGSIGHFLVRILSETGPQKHMDLRDMIVSMAAGTAVAETSVGVILASNPCFRRAAPGAYALYHGDLELREKLQPRLLDERQCRTYCYARHGGASSNYYPAWGPSFEMKLAKWAKAHAPTDLYRSLLSIADPDQWPETASERSRWLDLKRSEASWEIGTERRIPLGSRFADADQMFSVIAHLALFGWISWFAVNRATGSKTDNHDAADVLAFLLMSGLVHPEADWQGQHLATERALKVYDEACEERHGTGRLSWDGGSFGAMLAKLHTDGTNPRPGWLKDEDTDTVVVAWRTGELPTGKAYGGRQAAPIDVDQLFGSNAWADAFGA